MNASSDQYPWTDTTCRAGTPSRPRPHPAEEPVIRTSGAPVSSYIIREPSTRMDIRVGRPGAVWRAGARTPCRGLGHLMTCPKSRHPVPGPCSCPKSPALCAGSRSGCRAAPVVPAAVCRESSWLPSGVRRDCRAPPVIPGPTWYRGPGLPLDLEGCLLRFPRGNPPGQGVPAVVEGSPEAEAEAEAGQGRAGTKAGPGRRQGRDEGGWGEGSEGEEGGGVLPHDGFVFGGGEVGGFEGADGY